jgi:RNA polymerase sigma-70 factor (ECF subfamily)
MTSYALTKKEIWQAPMASPELHFELLQRISAGDQSALCELYAAYGQRLYAYALRLTNDRANAEDVVQETLVTVWRAAGKYRGEGRVLAWLLGIVHNLALKCLRQSSIPITDEMEATMSTPGASPEIQAQNNDQARWVQQALQNLSPEHRAVLELVFYQGLSLEEAAQVCNCPLGTVKSRLSYARQHLRGLISRQNLEAWR